MANYNSLQFIETHLEQYLNQFGKDRNPNTAKKFHDEFCFLMRDRWNQLDNINSEIIEFDFPQLKGFNLWIPPRDPNNKFIIIFGHFDTVPNCPGWDDNGSALAIIDLLVHWYNDLLNDCKSLNIAFLLNDYEESDPRIWSILEEFQQSHEFHWSDLNFKQDSPLIPKWTEFVNERLPQRDSFVGIRNFVKYLITNKIKDKVEVFINLETVGFTGEDQLPIPNVPVVMSKGDFIGLVGNHNLESWINRFMNLHDKDLPELQKIPLIVPQAGHMVPDTRNADQSVLWDMNLPAIMLTNTAYFRNNNYHKSSDTEVDFNFMARLCQHLINLFENI